MGADQIEITVDIVDQAGNPVSGVQWEVSRTQSNCSFWGCGCTTTHGGPFDSGVTYIAYLGWPSNYYSCTYRIEFTDVDGYETPDPITVSLRPPETTVVTGIYTSAGSTWYKDADADGYSDQSAASIIQETRPDGYSLENELSGINNDCNDGNAAIHPGATEVCDTIDNNCDGNIDEGVTTIYYRDNDGDGYGNSTNTIQACSVPSGYVSDSADCNDDNSAVHPGAVEICDTVDNDCDGEVDEGVTNIYYRDNDGDGYGDSSTTTTGCSAPSGYVSDNTDCNDSDATIHPGGSEVCDGVDNDCDGDIDDGLTTTTYYRDDDGDGFGDPDPEKTTQACSAPSGYVSDNTDCNDSDVAIHPGASEVCDDDVDNNCDGEIDETTTYYRDDDGDGYGDSGNTTQSCFAPSGYVADNTDCDDSNAAIHPGVVDYCGDGIDKDCSGTNADCDGSLCVDISDVPLDTQFQAAAANIMFVLDNSGSMDFSFLTSESGGGFGEYDYVFPMSENKYSGDLPAEHRDLWKSQWAGYNKLYYDPSIVYKPWPATASYGNLQAFSGSSSSLVKTHPVIGNETLDLDNEYSSSYYSGISIKNAHYYTQYNNNTYLVMMANGGMNYYRLNDDSEDSVKNSGLTQLVGDNIPAAIIPTSIDTQTAYDSARQNFANWFTFYRRRSLSANVALANVIKSMSGVNVGIYTINQNPTSNPDDYIAQSVLPVHVDGADYTDTLLDLLYELEIQYNVGTPLRKGLKAVGQYFDDTDSVNPTGLGSSPFESLANGGACQQTFAILMTDGYWSGDSPSISDQDGDGHSNTLADVAMYFYKNDLSNLADLVPVNSFDTQTTQHMVTYGVAFGVNGTLDPADYPDCPENCSTDISFNPNCDDCPTWPDPNSDARKIDDLYHATVNARGELWSADNPSALATALESLLQDIELRMGSGASLTINSQQLNDGTVLYQGTYSTDTWSGDIKAYGLNQTTGDINATANWSAAKELADDLSVSGGWSSDSGRKVFTLGNSGGISFESNNSTEIGLSDNLINYIRGDDSNEGHVSGQYRVRSESFGDIVHSAPYLVNNTIFAGANDGMIHAFNTTDGTERFAYVPKLVVPNLHELTNQDYSHKYFVDLTPYAKSVGSDTTLLVGGLGKGGKGYYCLDISDVATPTALEVVKWEYPNGTTDNDLGYSFSRAYIVNSNVGWVVIFANGYDSYNSNAVLYVLNALTGNLIVKFDTDPNDGDDSCNGLSTPALIDTNLDGKVDYAYAGDLQGELWKFDLTGATTDDWHVSYGGNSLFQAKNKSGTVQPITTKPDVIGHCDGSKAGYIVIVGTGRYLGDADVSDTAVQTIYGIWDWAEEWENEGDGDEEKDPADKYYGVLGVPQSETRTLSNISSLSYLSDTAKAVTLLEQTVVMSNNTVRVLSDNDINWYSPGTDVGEHVGWYFDLPLTGERVIRDFEVRDNIAIMLSSIPSNTPCEAGGSSVILELDVCSGSRLNDPQFDYNEDGEIDDDDLVEIDDPDNPGEKIYVPPTGLKKPEMLYPPVIISLPGKDLKIFSKSLGNMYPLGEKPEQIGVYYWKESN